MQDIALQNLSYYNNRNEGWFGDSELDLPTMQFVLDFDSHSVTHMEPCLVILRHNVEIVLNQNNDFLNPIQNDSIVYFEQGRT